MWSCIAQFTHATLYAVASGEALVVDLSKIPESFNSRVRGLALNTTPKRTTTRGLRGARGSSSWMQVSPCSGADSAG